MCCCWVMLPLSYACRFCRQQAPGSTPPSPVKSQACKDPCLRSWGTVARLNMVAQNGTLVCLTHYKAVSLVQNSHLSSVWFSWFSLVTEMQFWILVGVVVMSKVYHLVSKPSKHPNSFKLSPLPMSVFRGEGWSLNTWGMGREHIIPLFPLAPFSEGTVSNILLFQRLPVQRWNSGIMHSWLQYNNK